MKRIVTLSPHCSEASDAYCAKVSRGKMSPLDVAGEDRSCPCQELRMMSRSFSVRSASNAHHGHSAHEVDAIVGGSFEVHGLFVSCLMVAAIELRRN
jgi:hypothetical protein